MCDWWISLGSRPWVLHVLHVLCCVNLCFCSLHLFEMQLINLTPTPTPTVVLRFHCHHPPSQAAEDNSRQREARMTIERDCRCQWSWFPKNWFKWNSEFLWVFLSLTHNIYTQMNAASAGVENDSAVLPTVHDASVTIIMPKSLQCCQKSIAIFRPLAKTST